MNFEQSCKSFEETLNQLNESMNSSIDNFENAVLSALEEQAKLLIEMRDRLGAINSSLEALWSEI